MHEVGGTNTAGGDPCFKQTPPQPVVLSGRCPSAESASISYFVSSEIDAASADGYSRSLRVNPYTAAVGHTLNRHHFHLKIVQMIQMDYPRGLRVNYCM